MLIYLIYNLFWFLSAPLFLPLVAIYLLSTGKKKEGLKDFLTLFSQKELKLLNNKKVIWFQAVSVGEVVGVCPVIQELKKNSSSLAIVLSVSSEAGFYWAKKNIPAEMIIYTPFDFLPLVIRSLNLLKPKGLVVSESGFWPNFLYQAKKRGVFTLLLQGRLSQKSFRRYRLLPFFSRFLFSSFQLICMQNRRGIRQMEELGLKKENLLAPLNTKFDLLKPVLKEEKEQINVQFGLKNSKVMLAASTHSGEEKPLLEVFLNLRTQYPNLIFILAPRRIERVGEIIAILKEKRLGFQRRSDLSRGTERKEAIIIIDNIGELSRLYAAADIVFVGASLVSGIGGHSLIEPLIQGKIPLHGPYMENHTEIKNRLKEKALAIEIKNSRELSREGLKFLRGERNEKKLALLAREFIQKNQGGSAIIADLILKRIKSKD